MPEYVYSAAEPRQYGQYGVVEPGATITADTAPDWRWTETAAPAHEPEPAPAPEPAPEPAEPPAPVEPSA